MNLDGMQVVRNVEESEIRSILGDGKPLRLYEQSKEFYGRYFSVRFVSGVRCSNWQVASAIRPPRLISASLNLVDEPPNRIRAVVVHELLHAYLAIAGYPVLVGTTNDAGWSSRGIADGCSFLINFIQHAIFLPYFVQMGFGVHEFLDPQTEPDSLEESTRRAVETLADPRTSGYARGLWNRYFFCVWLSSQMGTPSTDPDKILQNGRMLFPGADDDANRMIDWFDACEFHHPAMYADSVNGLLKMMGLPLVLFAGLRPDKDDLTLSPLPLYRGSGPKSIENP